MAIGMMMTLDGVTQEQYDVACGKAGLDQPGPANPDAGNPWPDALIAHVAGPTPTGWAVVDIWRSQEEFDTFLAQRLGPAMGQAGIPEPNVIAFEVYNTSL